jgi:hypothetical protein
LDALGITQRKLNGNFMSWMDTLSDQDKAEGGLWYPTGNDWGHYMSQLHGAHPDKVFGVMSKMSPQRDWHGNLDDVHMIASNYHQNPDAIRRPPGISGNDNLKQSLRVFGAEDDPDAIHAAFLGTKKNGRGQLIPRLSKDLPKTYDFYQALRDPETGGAGNYMLHPAVVDSWMSRSMLWSKNAWDKAQAGGRPLSWPGKGTGEGLDKHLPVKKLNPETGEYQVVGTRPPNARDVAARVVGLSGGYDRMRNAMRNGAAVHDMPFSHGAQAAVWKAISGNANPDPTPQYGDLSEIHHDPRGLWNEMWARRASGLHVPQQQGITAHRTAAHGVTPGDPHGPEDSHDEGWGTPEDVMSMIRHVQMGPPGYDHWEGGPQGMSFDSVPHPGPPERGYVMAASRSNDPDAPQAFLGHLAAFDDFDEIMGGQSFPHQMDGGSGGDHPWKGEYADALRAGCKYCGADPDEMCDPHCPTNHSEDPKVWERDYKALGGPPAKAVDDTMFRLNNVRDVLGYVNKLLSE